MDGPSKGLRVEDQEAKKQCLPENFPSSSTCEMDNSTVWSQRSMALAQSESHDSHSNIGSSTDFVNSGKCMPVGRRQPSLMFSFGYAPSILETYTCDLFVKLHICLLHWIFFHSFLFEVWFDW